MSSCRLAKTTSRNTLGRGCVNTCVGIARTHKPSSLISAVGPENKVAAVGMGMCVVAGTVGTQIQAAVFAGAVTAQQAGY